MKRTSTLSIKKNIKLEIVGLFFCSVIPGLVWASLFLMGTYLVTNKYYFGIILLPMVISLMYIALCFTIRLLIPKLKPGTYNLEKEPMVVVWYMHMSLSRSLNSTGLRAIIRSSNILKYLYYRALGAKIAYTANYSTDLEIIDPSLITMEKNVIIGGRCIMGCHLIYDNKLVLKPIHIKQNAFIQLNNNIGQGTTVGESAIVGNGNILYNVDIPDKYSIANFAWRNGTPNQENRFRAKFNRDIQNPTYSDFHRKHGFIEH